MEAYEEMRVLTHAELKNIQGIIISGYADLKQTAYLFLKFNDLSKAADWLKELIPDISVADWSSQWGDKKPLNAVNIAFTQRGIDVFDKGATEFSQEFTEGMVETHRSRRLGDDPKEWDLNCEQVHVLLILQATDKNTLGTLIEKYLIINKKYGAELLFEGPQLGYLSEDKKEHFGFSDSISQPLIQNSPASKTSIEPSIRAGEFILGYTNEYDQFPSTPIVESSFDVNNVLPELPGNGEKLYRDFGFNGSYLVFRKLEQDVHKFKNYLKTQIPDDEERTLIAAKCVGRWPSGAPLVSAPASDNPNLKEKNDFGYRKDPYGNTCPVGSHIRRANPRDTLREDPEESWAVVNRHRILRRGTLYGEPYEENEPNTQYRGIYFICINTDIKRQFEFIQQNWLNNPKFGDLYNERDPIAGSNLDPYAKNRSDYFITLPGESVRKRYKEFPKIVTVRGGGYFFLPSIPALRYLAGIAGPEPKPSNDLHKLERLEKNETKLIYSFAGLLKKKMGKDHTVGHTSRDAHPKTLGLLKADFMINDNIPDELKAGVFLHPGKEYKAWIRLSNSNLKINSDKKRDMRGFAIKLIEVEENKAGNDELHTQDFVLLSRPDMPMGTIKITRNFIRDTQNLGILGLILHPVVAIKLFLGFKKHVSPLDIRYWSTTPYQFGQEVVKFSVVPTSNYKSRLPDELTDSYLTENMVGHLSQYEASFDFKIQKWKDHKHTPVENAAVEWKEKHSPFIKVATIRIPIQDFNIPRRNELAEILSFSPNHTSADIKPLGGLNRARNFIYNFLSKYRHHRDGKLQIKHTLEHYSSVP